MSDFDLVLQGTVVLPDRIVEAGYVAVRDGKIVQSAGRPARTRANATSSARR